jgi:alkyl hydroperoxide reductase subunit D
MEAIDRLRQAMPSSAKDIQQNLPSVLQGGALSDTQRWGTAVACAVAVRSPLLRDAVVHDASATVSNDVIDDAQAAAVMMSMTNVYYRFRHLVGKPSYDAHPPRMRMNRLAQIKTEKPTFELMCLAVSAINGCEVCIRRHEASVLESGLTEAHVNDAVRIAATMAAAATALELQRLSEERPLAHAVNE